MIRNWYGFDPRFHSDTKAFANSIQEKNQSLPGNYSTIRIEVASESLTNKSNLIRVSKDEFANLKKQYPKPNHIYLKENFDSYVLTRVSGQTHDQLDLQLLNIPKKSFAEWWVKVAPTIALTDMRLNTSHYELPLINTGSSCEGWEDVDSLNGSPIIGRTDHTAVWTGSEMIIWGGQSNYVYLNSGARYNPATDTWIPRQLIRMYPCQDNRIPQFGLELK